MKPHNYKKEADIVSRKLSVYLNKIRAFMHQSKGFPVEIFDILLKDKKTIGQQLMVCVSFCEKNKKWCKTNNIILHYPEILKWKLKSALVVAKENLFQSSTKTVKHLPVTANFVSTSFLSSGLRITL